MLVVGGKASPRATHTSMPRRGEAAGAATPPSSDEDEEELSSSVSGGVVKVAPHPEVAAQSVRRLAPVHRPSGPRLRAMAARATASAVHR